MNPYDVTLIPSLLLGLSAVSTSGLGVFVFLHDPTRATHRLFALLMANLTLWCLGVLSIIHCPTEFLAEIAIAAAFVVASFLPATFFHFVSEFPTRRNSGVLLTTRALYAGGAILALFAFTPWHLRSVKVLPDAPPLAEYGPAFLGVPVLIGLSMVAMLFELGLKLRVAKDIERRQVQYVLFGIFLMGALATITNVVAPLFHVGSLELFGPCFTVLMSGTFAYAMVRYHLLDVWILVSRATVYAAVTAFVTLVFFGAVSLVHWMSLSDTVGGSMLSSLIAAVTIVVLVQPIKEWVQLIVERTLLRRRYDDAQLIERLARIASETVQLDALLRSVAEEVVSALGVRRLRVYLKEDDPSLQLKQAYPAEDREREFSNAESMELMSYTRSHPSPVSPQEIRYHWGDPKHQAIAEMLENSGARLMIPLRSKSGPVGMILLGEKDSHDMFSQQDHHVFRSVAGAIATAIDNARLYERLENLNLHLEQIMESMRAGVVAVDGKGQVTTVNEEARAMLGNVWPGDPLSQLPTHVSEMLEGTLQQSRGIGEVEAVITGPEGDLIPLALSSSYFETPSNEASGAMVLMFNLTEIKRLESSVQRADRLTTIGTMAAGMAHEIKNPLQSIKTFTQLLTKRYDDHDFRKTFSEVVPPEVQRIDDIVTQLLDFARPKPVEFRPQDLEQIVRDVMALMANQLTKLGISVKLSIPPNARMVTGDVQQLKQVFLNLFLNAIDAMENSADRTLTLRVHYGYCHVREKDGTMLEERPCAKVSISDTGCGIPGDGLRQLFNPFYTTKAHGSGLGLSVVHSIIAEHGGEIDITSAPGVGTTFFLVLPLAPAGVAEALNA